MVASNSYGELIQYLNQLGLHCSWAISVGDLDMIFRSTILTFTLSFLATWLASPVAPLAENAVDISLTEAERVWLDEHKTIRVGVDPAYPPFEFIDNNGEYRGMAADYIDLIKIQLGIEMEVVPGLTWPQVDEKLRKGEIDVSPALTDTPTRRGYLNFTQPYISFPTAIVTRTDRTPAESLESFAGKKLALVKGYYYVDQIVRDYPEIEPLFVETPLEAIKAVSFGKADGLIENLATVSHLIAEHNIPNLRLDAEADIQSKGLAIGVRLDWPIFADILNKALKNITQNEHRAIRDKWITIATKDQSSVPKVALTEQEKVWLKKHPNIVLGGGVFPPLDGVDAQGNVEGIGPDYATLLGEMLGIKFEFVSGNWAKMQERAKIREVDGLRLLAKNPEREAYLAFTEPYMNFTNAIFTRKDSPTYKSLADLKGKTVSTLNNSQAHKWLKTNHPDIILAPQSSLVEALDTMLTGKADAQVGATVAISYIAQNNLMTNFRMNATIPEMTRGFHIGIRKDWPELTAMLDRAISQIPRETHFEIKRKWAPLAAKEEKLRVKVKLTELEQSWLDEHQTIRLGVDPSYPPFEFIGDGGDYQGMSSDYITLIAERLGVTMVVTPSLSWSQVLEGAKSKQIDLLPAAANTEERQAYLQFTKPYIALPIIIMTRKDHSSVSGLEDFAGKTLTMVKDYYYVEEILRNYPDIKVHSVDTPEEGLEAVSVGKTDGMVINLGVGTYLTQKNNLLNLRVAADAGLKIGNLSMGVRKDWPQLVPILNKALDSITQEDLQKIRNKWISVDSEAALQVKVKLSDEERDWLDAHSPFRLGTDPDWSPIDFIGKDGSYQGITSDYIRLLGERLDVKIELIGKSSWTDSIDKMKANEIDILSSVATTPERQEFINFTQPFIKFPVIIMTRDDAPFIGDIEDLSGRTIAVVKEDLAHIKLRDNHPEIDLLIVDSTRDGLATVSSGKVFAFVGNLVTLSFAMKKEGITNLKVAAPTPYAYNLSIGTRKDWPQLTPLLDRALASITEAERNKIYNKWISTRFEHAVDYTLIWKVVGGGVVIILLVVIWNRKMGREIDQRKKAQAELTVAHDELGDAMYHIEGSITYASRIQRSILPDDDIISAVTQDNFVLWEPRDVVGGDIYWYGAWGDGCLILLGDCTGHGVPGAFMTLISIGNLERSISEVEGGNLGKLVARLHQYIQISLGQHYGESDSDDGIELGACYFVPEAQQMTFVGARFDLMINDGNGISIVKGTKKGMGYRGIPYEQVYEEQIVHLKPDQSFYLTTDGLTDQIGGERKRMFGKRRFKELLTSVQDKPMSEQKEIIYQTLLDYQDGENRRDDVAVIGFKL